MRNRVIVAALTLATLSGLTALARAKAAAPGAGSGPQQAAPPTIHVYSRETIVDVLVTNDKGQPVTGLKQSDFTIEEDGKPQPIRSFSEYNKSTTPPPPPTLPPNTFTNDNTVPASGPVQIFLFDLLGSRPEDMERAKKYIADYLRTMPTGTQVALFEFSPSKDLVLLQGFTTDGRAAAAAVDNLNVEWIRNPVYGTPIAIAGMNQIAAYVAGIKGRKNLVWIVSGMPLPIVHDGGLSWGYLDMTFVHRLMDLYDVFTREQIAIYPLDPRGVHGFGKSETAQRNELLDQKVADETGGAVTNSNEYQSSIATIVSDTDHGYTLSYVPPRPDEDGHYHTITIKLDRPGLRLNYRPGYNDEQPKPPDTVLKQQMVQGPVRLGAIPATQLIFDLHVESASPAAHKKTTQYNVFFQFDPRQLTLAEAPDGVRTASVELDLGAYDFYGKLITARSQTFKLTITPGQYAGFFRNPLKFPLAIDLPHGQLKLRAGLFDTTGNKAGTLEIPLTVDKK